MPDPSPDEPLSLPQRLAIVYERLDRLPAATSADEAFDRLGAVLDEVEDQYSGVAKNPDPGLKFDGRMYHPRADFTTRGEDGSIHAVTKGNEIHASADGTLVISSRRTGDEVYRRQGAGTAPGGEQAQQRVNSKAAKARSTTSGRRPSTPSPGAAQSPAHRPAGPEQKRGRSK
ncbi:hypothetical protein [Streptomyces sp. NPDC048636]|uniref:hypothetical protein n=1 Tax=Streptomyces sp. NPDC048636 TaxID=3155762 RepID=UPI0034425376